VETGKRAHHVAVEGDDFAEGARVLELGNRQLLNAHDNEVLRLHGNNGGTTLNSGVRVLDLEKTPVRTEASDRTTVTGHGRVTFQAPTKLGDDQAAIGINRFWNTSLNPSSH
jgi:hypothetical protein